MNQNEKYTSLCALLERCQKAYENGFSIIPDDVYDQLVLELQALEQQYGMKPNSPNAVIGYKDEDKKYIKHYKPLLSLEHKIGEDGLDFFLAKITRLLGDNTFPTLTAEPKIDGVSVALHYKDNVLISAALRGDGYEGEDITNNIIALQVPLIFNLCNLKEFELRGELYMPLNRYYALEQDKQFASPRHAVAGAVRLLDVQEFQKREIALKIHGFVYAEELAEKSYFQIMNVIKEKFDVAVETQCHTIEQAKEFFKHVEQTRENRNYLLDGVVYKIDNLELHKKLSYSVKAPRFAFALKFTSKSMISEIIDIQWNVGRTGVITPVIEIKPIMIDGVQINKVTLHNISELQKRNVRIGDLAVIERACDVIPAIIEVINNVENSMSAEVVSVCPSCNSEVVIADKFAMCKNGWECPEQVIDRLFHFMSRDAFDIDGLGQQKLSFLYNNKLIKFPSDIFNLQNICAQKQFFLEEQDGWGKKSVAKLFSKIEQQKEVSFAKFIYSLGIEGVGKSLSVKIAQYCQTWDDFKNWIYTAKEIDGVGASLSESMMQFVRTQETWVLDLLPLINLKKENVLLSNALQVVFTGKFSISRQAMKMHVSDKVIVKDNLNAQIDYLIYGEDAGSKFTKAKEMNIKCVNEQEWNEIIKNMQT